MAYRTRLASIPEGRIEVFRADKLESLHASRIVDCSHLIAYGVKPLPLGNLLGKAIDRGEILDASLWHPFRPPVFHTAIAVRDIYTELQKEWGTVQLGFQIPEDDWYGVQIKEIVELFGWASERKEATLSIMGLPHDSERAKRIIEPNLA